MLTWLKSLRSPKPAPAPHAAYLDIAIRAQSAGCTMSQAAQMITAMCPGPLTYATIARMVGDFVAAGLGAPYVGAKGRPRGTRNLLPMERESRTRLTA